MANRYSELTPSAYTPLTLEEIAMVPALKRKQHDTILAQQEALNSALVKTDPYKKHFNEALALKKGIEDKMSATASELAQSGVNPDMIGKTIALNREVQNLMSPTGKLGQINAEKLNIAKINEEYDKMAAQKGWSPAESEYWKNKALEEYNAKPIYGEDGRILQYTSPIAAPTRVDYYKEMSELAKDAKMSTTELSNAIQTLDNDIGSGQKAILGKEYGKKFGNNYTAVLNAYNTIKSRMLDPTSDMYKSMEYERRNPSDLLKQLAQQSEVYKQKAFSEESKSTINPFGSNDDDRNGSGKKEGEFLPEGIFDPSSTVSLENKVKEADYSGIGAIRDKGTLYPELKGMNAHQYLQRVAKSGGTRTYKDVLAPELHSQFEKAVGILIGKGKLPKGTDPMKITPAQAKDIGDYMKNNSASFTIGNDIIRPDIEASPDLFLGELVGKDANQRNALMDRDLDSYKRQILNPETNKPFTQDEWKEFRKEGGKAVYDGYDSPLNFRGYGFGNAAEQQVMAHKVLLYDKDGQPLGESAVSRTPQEMNTKEFKSSYNITHSYRNAIRKPNEWVPTVNTKSGLDVRPTSGMMVKYNNDGTISLKKGESKLENLTPQQFAKVMYEEMIGEKRKR